MTAVAQRLPDFFIVGAPKCGTTSLYRWLDGHPDASIPTKEPGYYSRDLVHVPYSKQDYLNFYREFQDKDILIGDATPRYLYSKQALQQILADRPDARVIVAVRNPVDLVISFHGQMVAQAFETERDFEKAWNLVEQRRAGNCLPRVCKSPSMLDYPLWGRIGSRLNDLFNVFASDRILPFVLDDLKTDPRSVYLQMLDFLGLTDDGRSDFDAENQRVEVRNVRLHQTLIAIRRKIMPVYRSNSFNGGIGVLKWVSKFNVRRADQHERVSAEFRSNLVDHFAEEVALTEQILSRDLQTWKQ